MKIGIVKSKIKMKKNGVSRFQNKEIGHKKNAEIKQFPRFPTDKSGH